MLLLSNNNLTSRYSAQAALVAALAKAENKSLKRDAFVNDVSSSFNDFLNYYN
jgi:hypothetical protein